MENYVDGNLGANIFSKKGVVLSSNVRSETHVSSHGGGGYLREGTGYVSGPSITSTVHRQQDIWIKTPEGLEECIRLKGCDLQVRQGNRVTFILAGRMGEDMGYYAMLVNHDTARWSQISSAKDLVSWMRLFPGKASTYVAFVSFVLGAGALGIGLVNHHGAMRYGKLSAYDFGLLYFLVTVGSLLLILSYCVNKRRSRIAKRRNQFVTGLPSHLERLGRETAY